MTKKIIKALDDIIEILKDLSEELKDTITYEEEEGSTIEIWTPPSHTKSSKSKRNL